MIYKRCLFILILFNFCSVFGYNYYPNSILRLPYNSASQSLAGIIGLSEAYIISGNPSINYDRKKVLFFSYSNYSLDKEDYFISFYTPLINKLSFSVEYLYRGVSNIDIYDVNEEVIGYEKDFLSRIFFAISYPLILKKSYQLYGGIGSSIYKRKVAIAEDYRLFNNLSLGITFKYKGFLEIGGSLLNIFEKSRWKITVANTSEGTETEIYEAKLPLKGILSLKYIWLNKFNFYYELQIEDLDYKSPHYIHKIAAEYKYKILTTRIGYGDQRVYSGAGVDLKFNNIKFLVLFSVFSDKLTGINGSIGGVVEK